MVDNQDSSLTPADRLAKLRTAWASLREAQGLEDWIGRAPGLIQALLAADGAAVFLVEGQEPSGELLLAAAGSSGQTVLAEEAMTLAAAVASSGQSQALPEQGRLAVPLLAGGEVVGVLVAQAVPERAFTEDDLRLAELFGDQVAAGLSLPERTQGPASNEFISLVTHQLRVPLTAMLGYTDLLLGQMAGPLTERQATFLATIRRNMSRMGRLIEDLSTISRLDSGRASLKRQRVDVRAVIDRALQSLDETAAARGGDIAIVCQADLPEIETDLERMVQVIALLIDNAARYSEPGSPIEVRAALADQHIVVQVIDQGIGISVADQEQLFTPFFRSEDSAVRALDGWGLSLALAHRLMKALGGQIACQSQAGSGSIFTLSLPAGGSNL